jgi:hypothetical protein
MEHNHGDTLWTAKVCGSARAEQFPVTLLQPFHVIAGLVPAIQTLDARSCHVDRDGRDTSAFTRVHSASKTREYALMDALCPAMTTEGIHRKRKML